LRKDPGLVALGTIPFSGRFLVPTRRISSG
jgi:hypothetical protein